MSDLRDTISRAILPIPDPARVGLTTYDAKDPDTKFPPIESLRPPKGAPNVLIVLIDDCGFGASSAFGGPIAEAATPIPAGTHQVRMEFTYDGGGLAKGGTVSLYVDGTKGGEGRIEMTIPMIFSADETCDVGREGGSPVSPDYGPRGNEFNGEVNWVRIELGESNHDHLISPEDRFQIAMARQ